MKDSSTVDNAVTFLKPSTPSASNGATSGIDLTIGQDGKVQVQFVKPQGESSLASLRVGAKGGGLPRYMPERELRQLRDALTIALGERFVSVDDADSLLSYTDARSLVQRLSAKWGFTVTSRKKTVFEVDIDVADNNDQGEDQD